MNQKFLFIDRDGTIISEPKDNFQIDHIDKLNLEPLVIPSLLALQDFGYHLVMITNQDGLGTEKFSKKNFDYPHSFLIKILNSQGIFFDKILICPHHAQDNCKCRKPKIYMLDTWLKEVNLNLYNSYVIGDRNTDIQLAHNIGIVGIQYSTHDNNWNTITQRLTKSDRFAIINRNTKETQIIVKIWLDREGKNYFNTGISFFDHMLDQIATHGGFRMNINVQGDLYIDDHHTIEDTALALGKALVQALGNKNGLGRFGFVLPMDESLAHCVIDISGRPFLQFQATFNYQRIGNFSTEMVEHFFRSLSYSMEISLHLKIQGKNDHHMAESAFKAFGRTLRQAIRLEGSTLPSSKGVL